VPLPFQGRFMHKLANAVKNKVHHLHRKTSEYQHYRYRQGQQSALASPRRTARYERIPPDGFDTAALEIMQRTLPLGQVCGAMWASPPTHSKRFI
ncbi:MAG TPA: hypothetical protein DEQ76_04420, partial [Ruminococcus sp.]|nr:hypothetical protein [Ruminococcus sp.]